MVDEKERQYQNKRDAALSEITHTQQSNILLEAILDQLITLNEKKQTAIDNQAKFEKKWSGFKKIAVITALGAPSISLLTGIIDPSTDWPIIAERANRCYKSTSTILEVTMIEFLKAIVSPITNLFGKVSDNKKAIQEKQIEKIINATDKEAAWEVIHAQQSKFKWTDDWFSILLSIPLIGAFIPPAVPHIQAGFDVLSTMPEYYQYWLAVAILSSFGIRAIKK